MHRKLTTGKLARAPAQHTRELVTRTWVTRVAETEGATAADQITSQAVARTVTA